MEAVVVFIALFAGIFGITYYHLQTRHRERMSLIEHGAEAKLFQTKSRKTPFFLTMLLGILFVSLSLGFFLGYVIDEYFTRNLSGDNPIPYFMSIFLCLGVGFIVAYFYHKKELEKLED